MKRTDSNSNLKAGTGESQLAGLRVCMLRESDYSLDSRARKQAATLAASGALVTMIGVGPTVPQDLVEAGYDVHLVPTPRARLPRLGREEVWRPLRVAVNLTYTRELQRRHVRQRSRVCVCEDAVCSAAIAAGPDVIHAYNIRTLPAAVRAKRATGAPILYDCRDLQGDVEYYDEALAKALQLAEAELIDHVDAVITVSEPLAEILHSRYGIARPTVVYNGPSTVMPRTMPVHEPVRLLFQGALRESRNLSALIEAMTILRGRATLTLQGFGETGESLSDKVSELQLDDVVSIVPAADPSDVVVSGSAHDVGVICYRADSLNLASAVPNKLMDYLGAGLALAVSDLPGHRSVLEGTGAATFIDPSTSETIARDLSRLLDVPDRISEMKRSSLATAKRYEWAVEAEKLRQVYLQVTGQSIAPKTV